MNFLFFSIAWLTVGYFFTLWFVNSFLDNRSFVDQNHEVSPLMLIMLTITGPLMGSTMLLFIGIDVMLHKTGPFINKMYGG